MACPIWDPPSADPNFPYENGSIGTWGYGVLRKQPHDPSTHFDLSSSCDPPWISDYGWNLVRTASKRLRRHRLQVRLGLGRPQPIVLERVISPTAPPELVSELTQLYRQLDQLGAGPRAPTTSERWPSKSRR